MTESFPGLAIAVLAVSDTRSLAEDRSGDYLCQSLQSAGHRLAARAMEKDDAAAIRQRVMTWIDDPDIDVVLTTGGTGFAHRDVTPEALEPLLDKPMPGFGELFRMLSWEEIGTSSLQSRAFGGLAGHTWLFCLPGSTGACRCAWEKLLKAQLDRETRPCNLAEMRTRP